jgi:6-pyruvoyltetrahydropterin/6-carboxytetrahydropterin synthase
MVEVTRTFRFSAAHRLHAPEFSLAENVRLYGRCNNPSGHGHTYHLAVTIRGPVSPDTGWVADGPGLTRLVRARVLRRFDRANLNDLIRPADGVTSTTEVLAGKLWQILEAALPAGRLWRLRLEETPNNFFEVDRSGMAEAGLSSAPRAARGTTVKASTP